MPEKISIVKESGETINSNIVSVFMIPDTGKRYIITTENAVDPHGLTVLHVSEIVDGTLQKIATDDEWSSIKTIMRAIISGNVVSYQYLQPLETVNAASQYSRDISVSSSASKQMVDNYNAAEKTNPDAPTLPTPEGIPADTGVLPEPTPIPEPESPLPPPTPEPASNSIFPTPEAESSGDEVVPGISEVPVSPEPAAPVLNQPADATVSPQPDISINTNPIDPNPAMINPQPVNQMGNINIGFNNDVQVVDPTQGVPTGQIVQDATIPPVNMMNNFQQMPMQQTGMMPTNINPSFNPNATIDEVIVAAQEMFMVGVKNLVDTIQEKLYRDLYARESELKAREEAVALKEQMYAVNPAMMGFSVGMMGMNPAMNNMSQGIMANPMNPMMSNVGMPMQQTGMMPQQPAFPQNNMMQQLPMQQMGTPQPIPVANPQMPQIPVTVSATNDNV